MTDHAMPDTDRIALSAMLSDLSERFTLEATLWNHEPAVTECNRVARYLAQLARGVLTAGDLEVINAYAEAARILIGNIVGVRRFFTTITTLPSVRRP